MKNIVISCGPIPARLDSVKFITNKFKGGLAFKTAQSLIDTAQYDVTIVKWVNTDKPEPPSFKGSDKIPSEIKRIKRWREAHTHIVNVDDVADYCKWFENNAMNYDAFILAAAVANLMPSEPYEGKFPSHNYSVGEQFEIKFEIAPRAIDIIKKLNTRSCLIGYKLFDAETDEELVKIARHTLKDSKANAIFANTPREAKTRKIAVMQGNTNIKMGFEAHISFMQRLINAEYFKTEVINEMKFNSKEKTLEADIFSFKQHVKLFEKTFEGFGTVAFKVKQGIVTTARGHMGEPVYVKDIDFKTRTITADGKATLNAPLLYTVLQDKPIGSYVVHRHEDDDRRNIESDLWDNTYYRIAGTTEELLAAEIMGDVNFNIIGHGYIDHRQFNRVDWNIYNSQFPAKYFGIPEEMQSIMDENIHKDCVSLEVGGNKANICTYNLDTNIKQLNNKITYLDLEDMKGKFDFILLRNSINYLTENQLELLKEALKVGGIIVANSFANAPDIKITDNEVSIKRNGKIEHTLMVGDQLYKHSFYARGKEEYKALGFKTKRYSKTGILIKYKRNK